MNPLLYMLAGAAIMAAGYGVVLAARASAKAIETVGHLSDAVSHSETLMARMESSMNRMTDALNKFSGELEFLRTAMVGGGGPNFGTESPGGQTGGLQPSSRPPIPPYPGALPNFMPIPDAEETDTVIVDTSDEELVEQERLEETRGQGFEAEPLENPPGIERSV